MLSKKLVVFLSQKTVLMKELRKGYVLTRAEFLVINNCINQIVEAYMIITATNGSPSFATNQMCTKCNNYQVKNYRLDF